MNNENTIFEQIKSIDEVGNEYWGARKISKVLDYREFRNFLPVIEKAKEACLNSGQNVSKHFVEFHEAIVGGNNAIKEYLSVKLSRYACYLIVQNAGVISSLDYAIFQNHGYKGLYGGLDAKGIHQRKGLKKSQKNPRSYGQYGISGQFISRYSNGRKIEAR